MEIIRLTIESVDEKYNATVLFKIEQQVDEGARESSIRGLLNASVSNFATLTGTKQVSVYDLATKEK